MDSAQPAPAVKEEEGSAAQPERQQQAATPAAAPAAAKPPPAAAGGDDGSSSDDDAPLLARKAAVKQGALVGYADCRCCSAARKAWPCSLDPTCLPACTCCPCATRPLPTPCPMPLPHAPAEPKSDTKPAAKGKAAAAVKKVSSWGTGWRPGSQPLQCRLGRALRHRLALQPRLARACHVPNCLACCLTPPRTQEPASGEKPAAKKAAPKKAAAREDKPAAAKKPAAKERKPAAGSSAADAKVRAVPAPRVGAAAAQRWRVPLCLLAALPPAV